MNQVVQWEVKDDVGIITLNRPEKRNAINGEVLEGLEKAVKELSSSAEARVILMQGAGPVFSAGIDFNYLGHISREDGRPPGVRLREGIATIHSLLNRIEHLEKPVVAKIHGFCGGLGLELALTADFRLASETASLGVPEIILGLIPRLWRHHSINPPPRSGTSQRINYDRRDDYCLAGLRNRVSPLCILR